MLQISCAKASIKNGGNMPSWNTLPPRRRNEASSLGFPVLGRCAVGPASSPNGDVEVRQVERNEANVGFMDGKMLALTLLRSSSHMPVP